MTRLICVVVGHRWVPEAWLTCVTSDTRQLCSRCYKVRFTPAQQLRRMRN